ncbi:putative wd40 protein [Aspergillus varians]
MSDTKHSPLPPIKEVTNRQTQRDTMNEESSSDELTEIPSESITIAIFCALSYEAVAVKYSLDEEFTCRPKSIGRKKYVYSFGRIADHYIVIARPHDMGIVKVAQCATAVSQQFPNVRLALMVGIGAGIASLPKHDIRLGDLVISLPKDGHPGVVQYDFVKYERDKVILKGCLDKPPPILLSADGSLQEDEMMERHPLKRALRKLTNISMFKRPDTEDILFDKKFHHVNRGSDCSGCEASSVKMVVSRPPRPNNQPIVHRGLILSGSGVVKSTQTRDQLHRRFTDALCFETEAAGIMDEIPCLVVRGICDYADTHKQDTWHHYAAAVAAAYCKTLLRKVDSQEVEEVTSMKELIQGVKKLVEGNVLEDIDRKIILESLHPVQEASFNSYRAEGEGKCLHGTRIELLSSIASWGSSLSSQRIYWLNGMAGTGKSTISRTAAASFQSRSILAASFFFKRGAGDQGNARRLFSTIAWQLTSTIPSLAIRIKQAINKEPDLSAKSIEQQFNQLLLQPLCDLEQSQQQQPCLVIVIDALDECKEGRDIDTILQLLPRVQEIKTINLRFFITSRPELPTVLGFRKLRQKDHQYLILHEIPTSIITRDIKLFLEQRLSEIREKRSLPEEWPGKERLQTLISIAIPLFIFAATVCRFLEDLSWSPEERLNEFLSDPAARSASEMDRTYLPILKQLLKRPNEADSNKLNEEFHEVIGIVILLAKPLSVNALTAFIDRRKSTVKARLESFWSVLSVPGDDDMPVIPLHLSFRDFLLHTKHEFRIDKTKTHQRAATHCFRIMNSSLKHNICSLSSYGTQRTEIDDHTISQHISAALQYSCRYWVYHLEQGEPQGSERDVFEFLKKHFLHWLEVMGLMDLISETVGMISTLQFIMRSNIASEFSKFLHDAQQFILHNRDLLHIAPLQLYCSGLAFAPMHNIIRGVFKSSQRWMHSLPQVEDSWYKELQDPGGYSNSVRSVAFSPDGRMVVSGSTDHSIKLWDTKTGAEIRTIKGRSNLIPSVAFSIDRQMIAPGPYDKLIKILDAKNGTRIQSMDGHSGPVSSVAFSADSQTIASGSQDKTLKLWDTKSGRNIQTLKGHGDSVRSIAFSADSQMVASGSYDKLIKLWDAKSGTEIRSLKGHIGPVFSVAFSADGQMIASGSSDHTIKLWDTKTGAEIWTIKEHSHFPDAFSEDWVQSVSFSADGQIIASGSMDNTIGLWDTKSGAKIRSLIGHSSWVQPDALSADGQAIRPSFQMAVEDDGWVAFAGEQILWLPEYYRCPTCFTSHNHTLALGHHDGRVSIMAFRAPPPICPPSHNPLSDR